MESGVDLEIDELALLHLLAKPVFELIEGDFVDGDVFAIVAAAGVDFLQALSAKEGDDFVA